MIGPTDLLRPYAAPNLKTSHVTTNYKTDICRILANLLTKPLLITVTQCGMRYGIISLTGLGTAKNVIGRSPV